MAVSEAALTEGRPGEPSAVEHCLPVVADAMGCGVLVLDADGRITEANSAAEGMLGLSREQMRGQAPASCWQALREDGSEMREEDRPSMLALRTGLPVRNVVVRAICSNGRERWLQIDAVPVVRDRGQPLRLVSTLIDLTERKRVEEESRLLQTIMMAISEADGLHAALGIALRKVCEATGWVLGQAWTPRAAGDVLELSPASFCRVPFLDRFRAANEGMVFQPEQGLVGQVWARRQPGWIRDVTREPPFLRAAAAKEAGLKTVLAVPVLAGEDVVAILEFFAFQPRLGDERLVGIVSAVAAQVGSVLRRKWAEQQLAQREKQLAEAQKIAHLGSWEWDLARNTIHWSDELCRILGRERQETQTDLQDFLARVHPDSRPHVCQALEEALRTASRLDIEYRALRQDGATPILHSVGEVVSNDAGEPIRVVGITKDITERKRDEEERARLYEEAHDRAARLRLLVELGDDLVSARDLDTQLQLALARATAFSGCECGSVLLLTGRGDRLEVRASIGAGAMAPGTLADGHSHKVATRALRERRPLVLRQSGEELATPRPVSTTMPPFTVCLPLVTAKDRAIGVLTLTSASRIQPLQPDDLETLQLLTTQLAGVIESTLLHDRLQKSLDALLALHVGGQLLNSSLDLEEVGRRLLSTATAVTGLEAGVIRLRNARGQLRIWQTVGPEELWRRAQQSHMVAAAHRAALEGAGPQFFQLSPREGQAKGLIGWCLPLRVQGRAIGVLWVHGFERHAGEAAGEILGSLANQAASALENARLYRELAKRRYRLQSLVGRLLLAHEEERHRVAYEIHDGLAQVAAGAHQHLQAYARHHRPRSPQARQELELVLELARRSVQEARRVIAGLRPTALDDFGLATALRLKVEALRAEGWSIEYEEDLGKDRLPPMVETALYRVTQEALSNVRKHAQTTAVHISLQRAARTVRLEIRDRGRGFRPSAVLASSGPSERVGLAGMQERLALLDGRWSIRSRPGAGTQIVAEVPLPGLETEE